MGTSSIRIDDPKTKNMIWKWKKIEDSPDEIELTGDCLPELVCPFCRSSSQQFISYLSRYGVDKKGRFCSNCSNIYYGEWVDPREGK